MTAHTKTLSETFYVRGIFARAMAETRLTVPVGVSLGDHKYWNIALQYKWLKSLHCKHVKWFWQEVGSGFGWGGVHYFYDKLHPHKQPDGYYFYFEDPDFQKLLNYVDYVTPHFITTADVTTPIYGMGSDPLPWNHEFRRGRAVREAKMIAHLLRPYLDRGKCVEIIIFLEINGYLSHPFPILDFVECQSDAIKAVDSRFKTACEMGWGCGPGQAARYGKSDWEDNKKYFDVFLKPVESLDDVVFTFYPDYRLDWENATDRQLIIDDFTAIVDHIRGGGKGTWLSEFGSASYDHNRSVMLDVIYNHCVVPNDVPFAILFQLCDNGDFGLVR